MKTLKNNIKFKIYLNGKEFLEENQNLLNASTPTSIKTAFFPLNAKSYHEFNRNNFALKFSRGKEKLFILKQEPFNMLLFGSKELCNFAANTICNLNLSFKRILGEDDCVQEFLSCYQDRIGGEIYLEHSMKIMTLHHLLYTSSDLVFQCDFKNLYELAECYCAFQKEIFHIDLDSSKAIDVIKGKEQNYYALKVNEEIVSIACKTRDSDKICAISHVFTKPKYRGKGYAKEIVSKISQDILQEGKIPYLYVETTNPVSNHIYLSLGFKYLVKQSEYQYCPSTIQKAIFAGGCFWCMAEPFYSLNGVRKVISGYVGGREILPTYKDVKSGNTQYREAILIEYDTNKVKYSTLLDIYFSGIDPFDSDGQYIDRGKNYTCGIYTNVELEKQEVNARIKLLEEKFHQKVYVELCEDKIFYPAEEEHQEYALKHPKELQEELEKSGRKKEKIKMAKTVYHVSKRENNGREWKVFIQGSTKVIKLFDTQAEALSYAKGLCKNKEDNATVMLHGLDGKIRKA